MDRIRGNPWESVASVGSLATRTICVSPFVLIAAGYIEEPHTDFVGRMAHPPLNRPIGTDFSGGILIRMDGHGFPVVREWWKRGKNGKRGGDLDIGRLEDLG